MEARHLRIGAVVVAAFLLPNLAILLMHRRARRSNPESSRRIPVTNFAEVDDRLWRGAAPNEEALVALAANGVTTVVDLRAETGVQAYDALRRRLGVTRVHLPLRDGQAPNGDQVERFRRVVGESHGRVFVHCGAGVGRTGTMSAAYLVPRAGPRERRPSRRRRRWW